MYQALYRKWRPRTFDDVVGQEQVTETLKNQIKTGRLSHAYLFIGTRGTGKTSCAKILAKAVNCENPENGSPCNQCVSCRGIDDGSIFDVVELDAASNNGVDNVRALRDEAIFSPAVVKKRVYIVDEVHMLSASAFSALLKILEEPPAHLMFILATTELNKVPATILSRCQRHSFRRIDPEKLASRLRYVAEQETLSLESDAAELLARLADGSLRDGLSLLDQCSGIEYITVGRVLSALGLLGNRRIAELLDAVLRQDTACAVGIFDSQWRDGKAPATLLGELSGLIRDVLMIKIAPKGGAELLSGAFGRETLQGYAEVMTAEALIGALDILQERLGSLRDGRDPKTAAELCVVELCEPRLGGGIDALRSRVAEMEAAVSALEAGAEHAKPAVLPEPGSREKPAEPETGAPPFDIDAAAAVLDEDMGPPREIPQEENDHDADESAGRAESVTAEPAAGDMPPTDGEAAEETPESDTAAGTSGEVAAADWPALVAALKDTMKPGQYSIVSNSRMVRGAFSGGLLTIGVPNAFVRNQLEQQQSFDCIRAAAQKLAGGNVHVKIIEEQPPAQDGAAKLDRLSQFGNVRFEQ